ncbi:hypothetical protein GCM10029978_068620 [Actinoallomurus acanthiterrae]
MDADRGAVLLPTLPSAPDLPPEAAGVLGEVPARLGVPFVSPIFNALAAFPDFLVPAWEHSRRLIGSPAFSEAAARLTVPAELLPGRDDALSVAGVDVDLVRRYTATFHRLVPELLLLASCLYHGLTSDAPVETGILADTPVKTGPLADTPPRGVRPDAVTLAPAATPPDPELLRLYEEIRIAHGLPRTPSYYRALGRWPSFLSAVWERLGPIVREPAYAAARERLLAEAATAAAELPAPYVETPSAGDVRAVLAVFRLRLIPPLLLDTGIVLALLGRPTDPEPRLLNPIVAVGEPRARPHAVPYPERESGSLIPEGCHVSPDLRPRVRTPRLVRARRRPPPVGALPPARRPALEGALGRAHLPRDGGGDRGGRLRHARPPDARRRVVRRGLQLPHGHLDRRQRVVDLQVDRAHGSLRSPAQILLERQRRSAHPGHHHRLRRAGRATSSAR